MEIQAGGKIVVAGYVETTSENFVVARYHPNGTLDTTFGENGFTIIDFNNMDDQAYAIALRSDGKIVAAGYNEESETGTTNFAIMRLWP